MRRLVFAAVVALGVGVWATPAASAQQMMNFYIGGFTPRSEDARVDNDVLVNDIFIDRLAFNVSDFGAAQVGAEYLVALGDLFEAGLGVGYQQRSVHSVYADVVNDATDPPSEIEQTLRLRIVPFTATVRFLPLGHHAPVQPYIGGGVGVFAWRYSETGDFVFADGTVRPGNFVGSGGTTGPMVLGGVRVPIGGWGLGGEIRWQSASGDLPSDQPFVSDDRFSGPVKIDLGGFTYLFTVNVRF